MDEEAVLKTVAPQALQVRFLLSPQNFTIMAYILTIYKVVKNGVITTLDDDAHNSVLHQITNALGFQPFDFGTYQGEFETNFEWKRMVRDMVHISNEFQYFLFQIDEFVQKYETDLSDVTKRYYFFNGKWFLETPKITIEYQDVEKVFALNLS